MGGGASPEYLTALFGTARSTDGAELSPATANGHAERLHALVDALRAQRPAHAPLRVVAHGSPAERAGFFGRLVADGYEPHMLATHAKVVPKL